MLLYSITECLCADDESSLDHLSLFLVFLCNGPRLVGLLLSMLVNNSPGNSTTNHLLREAYYPAATALYFISPDLLVFRLISHVHTARGGKICTLSWKECHETRTDFSTPLCDTDRTYSHTSSFSYWVCADRTQSWMHGMAGAFFDGGIPRSLLFIHYIQWAFLRLSDRPPSRVITTFTQRPMRGKKRR